MVNSTYWTHIFFNGKWVIASKLEANDIYYHESSGMKLTIDEIHQGWSIVKRGGMWVKAFNLTQK